MKENDFIFNLLSDQDETNLSNQDFYIFFNYYLKFKKYQELFFDKYASEFKKRFSDLQSNYYWERELSYHEIVGVLKILEKRDFNTNFTCDHFKFYNPHPRKIITSDCVVRSLTNFFEEDYIKIRKEVRLFSKNIKEDNYRIEEVIALFVKKKVEIIDDCNLITEIFTNETITVNDFLKRKNKGKIFVLMKEHATIINDSIIYDTWNCSNEFIEKVFYVKN